MTPAAAELRREAIRDSVIVGAGVGMLRSYLAKTVDSAHADDCERALIYARQSLNELEALRTALRDHFDRLGAPPSLELNRR